MPRKGERPECKYAPCTSKASGKGGYCKGHAGQIARNEKLSSLRYKRTPVQSTEQVLRERTVIDLESGCYLWQGSKIGKGYGQIRIDGVSMLVHKVAYELFEGPIPDGMFLDHEKCVDTTCWNPSHLRLVTNKQNMENLTVLDPRNKTGYRGVSWDSTRKKYRSYVNHEGKQINLGRFDNALEAAVAARDKRLELYTHNTRDKLNS